jgi:hypothetical protein
MMVHESLADPVPIEWPDDHISPVSVRKIVWAQPQLTPTTPFPTAALTISGFIRVHKSPVKISERPKATNFQEQTEAQTH